MACRGPDHLYTRQQLQEIIKCSYEEAADLLKESRNNVDIAVENYFAKEDQKVQEIIKDVGKSKLGEITDFSQTVQGSKQTSNNLNIEGKHLTRLKSKVFSLEKLL